MGLARRAYIGPTSHITEHGLAMYMAYARAEEFITITKWNRILDGLIPVSHILIKMAP